MARLQGNNMPKVKQQNSKVIREVIFKHGPISRSQISQLLSLTPPTITTNVANLIAIGIVEEKSIQKETANHSLGRKAINIDIVKNAGYVIGCEFSPYQTYMCIADLLGNIVIEEKKPAASNSYMEMIAAIKEDMNGIVEQSGIDGKLLLGAGIVFPGFIDEKKRILRGSLRKDWNGREVAKDISRALGLPVQVDNNVRARAICEEMKRGKKRADTFAYFFVSKGIACHLVVKNKALSSGAAGAGEVGHMVVEVNGETCPVCGNQGCLEAYSSEEAISAKCAELLKNGKAPYLEQICENIAAPKISEILQAQQHGEESVKKIVEKAVVYLGITLANIVNFMSPNQVIIDAYIMHLKENSELMQKIVHDNLFGMNETEVELEFLNYNPFGGAQGGAFIALKKYFIQGG